MANFNQDAILKLKVDSTDVKKGVDAAIKEVDRLAAAIAQASKVKLDISDSSSQKIAPTTRPTKATKPPKATKETKDTTSTERLPKGLDGAAKKEFQKLMAELKKSLGQNLDFASGREKSKIQKSTLDKRFDTMKKAEALYLQLGKDQKSLIDAFKANADSLRKVQKNFEERTKTEYDAPEISADRSAYEGKSTAEIMKMMVEAKKKLASLENQNNNPGATYDKSSPAFDALAKSVESLVRQLSNSSGTEQIGYSSTNRQLGSGGARGFAAKSRNQDYTHVAMSDAIGKRLETGNMIREDLVTLIHEIRHAMQNEIERTGGEIEYLLDPKNDKESALVSKVGKLYENDPRVQAREVDANIFAERTVDAIADALGLSFADLNTALGATKDVLKQLRAEYFEHKKALDSMDMDNPDYSKQEKLLQDAKSRVMGAFMDMGVGLDGSPTKTRPMINGKIDGQDEISSELSENLEPFAKAQKKLIDYVSKIETGATKNPKADAMEKYLNIAEVQRERLELGESEVEDLEGTVQRLNSIIELLNTRLGRQVADELDAAAEEATDFGSVANEITTAVEQLSVVKKALASIGDLNIEGFTKLENQLNQAAEIGASLDVVSATKNLIGKIEEKLMSVADGSEIAGANIDLGAFSKKITDRVQDLLNNSLSDTASLDLNIRLDDVQAAMQNKIDSTIADLKTKIDAAEIIGNLPDVDVSELFVKISKQIVEAISDYVNLLNSDIANAFEGKDLSEVQQALNKLQESLVESVKKDLYGMSERLTTPEVDLSEVTKCLNEISDALSTKIRVSLDNAKQVLNSTQTTNIDASEISNAVDNAVMGLSDVVSESQEDLSRAFRAASDKIVVPDFDLTMLQDNINGFATRLNKKINALYKTLPRVIANEIKNAGATELDTSFLPEMMSEVGKKIANLVKESAEKMLAEIASVNVRSDNSEDIQKLQTALNELNDRLAENFKQLTNRIDSVSLVVNDEVADVLARSFTTLNEKAEDSLRQLSQVFDSVDFSAINTDKKANIQEITIPDIKVDVPDLKEISDKINDALKRGYSRIEVTPIELTVLQENINEFQRKLGKTINDQFKAVPKSVTEAVKSLSGGQISVEPIQDALNKALMGIDAALGKSLKSLGEAVSKAEVNYSFNIDLKELNALNELVEKSVKSTQEVINNLVSEATTKLKSSAELTLDISILEANLKNFAETLSDKLNGLLKTFPKALSSQIKEINPTDLDLAPIKEAAEKLNNKLSGIVDKNATFLNQSVNIKDAGQAEVVEVDLVSFQNTLNTELTNLIDSAIKKIKAQIKALPEVQADLSGFEAKFATISEGLSVEVEAFALKFSKKAISALTSSANKIKLGDLDLGRLNTAMLLHINQVIDNVKKQIDRLDSTSIDTSNFDASVAQFNEAMGKFANEAIAQLGVKVSQSVKDFKLPDLDLDSIQESAKTLYMVVKSAANPIMSKLSNKIQAEIDKAVSQDLTADNTAVLKKALELSAKKVTAKVSASLVEATKASMDKFEIPAMEIKGVQALIDKFNIKITKLAENAAKSLVDAISTLENQFKLPEIDISGKFEAIGVAAQKGVETFGQKIADSIQKEMETIKYPKTTLEASAKNLSAFDSKIKEYVKDQIADLVQLVEGQKGINLEGIKMAVNSIESSFNDLIKDHIAKLVAEVKAYKNPGNTDFIQSSFDGMSAKLAAVIENLISQAKIAITNYKGGAYKDAVNDAMKGISDGLLAYVATTTNELKTKIETQKASGLTGLATILKQLTTAVEKKAVEASTALANAIAALESTANPAALEKVQAKLQSALEKTMSDLVNALIKGSVDIGSVTKQVDTTDRLAKALTDKVDRLIQMSVMAINATSNNATDFGDLSRAATVDVEKALHKQAYQMISKLHAEISSVSLPKSAFSDIKNMMTQALKSSLDLNLDALKANEGADKLTMLDNSEDIKKYLNEIRKAIGTALTNSAAESAKTLKIDTTALDKVVAGVVKTQLNNAAKNLKTVDLVSPEIQAIDRIGEALSDRIEQHVLSIAKSIHKVPLDFDKGTATSAAINIEKGINGLVYKTLQDYTQAMSSVIIKANLLEIKKKVKDTVETLLSKGIDDMSSQLINESVLSDKIKAKAEQAVDSLAVALVRVIRNIADVANQMAERGFTEGDGSTVPGSPRQRTRVLSDAEVSAREEERTRANAEKDARRRQLQEEADSRRRMLQEEADERRRMLRDEADERRRAAQEERAAKAEERDRDKQEKSSAVQEQEAASSQFDLDIEQVNAGLGFATDLAETIAPNIAEGLDMFADLFRQISSADQSVDELVDSMNNISAPTMFVGAIAGLGKLLGTVAPVADSFQRLENILSTTSKIKFDSVKSSLMEMSRTLGTDLAASTEQFGQFASSLEGGALEGQAIGIFESVTKYSAALGMSTDAQNRSFTALTQIASKNKVQMEELQGQLAESLPGAVNKAAKALGITKAEMYDMMKAGELTATEFLPALARELENSADAMAGFNAAPMSQQLQILKGQLTTGFVDLLLPLFDGFQDILQSVIQFSSATGAMGVVALTVFSSLILVLAKSALGLQQNVALTAVLSKSLMVLRGFLVSTVAPMAALAALIAVGTTTLQAFNGELSKSSEAKSFKSLNETLEKTLEKLDELREKIKPNSIKTPISLSGIETDTKRVEELKEEYEGLNFAQKIGSRIAASYKNRRALMAGEAPIDPQVGDFAGVGAADFAQTTLEKENEERDKAMNSVYNMIDAYDDLLGLSFGLVSYETEAYKKAQAKESSLNRQEAYYKNIASAASAIEMGDGSDPEKLAEIKTTLDAINNNNKGQGFELLKLEDVTSVESALDYVKNAQGDILAQRDDLADDMILFDPDLVKSGIETARLTLATAQETDDAYSQASYALKELYKIQAALNGLSEKNLVTTKAFRDAYRDMVDQKADNKFTSSLVPKVAELDLYNRALKSGATDINDLTMEKRKIESASHHMRLKQLRQERAAMDAAALKVDSDTLAKMSEITGNMKLATAKGLKMSMLTSEDMDKLLSEESQEKLSKPLFDFLSEYKESRQDNVAEQVDELLSQKELMFDISSEYAEFEAQAQEDLSDYAQQQNDAVAGYNQTVQDTIDNMHGVIDSLNRAIEDVEIDTKALKIQNDSKAISNEVKRTLTAGTGTLMSNLVAQLDTFLGIQTEELTGELELTKEATQIKRSFEDGVLGIKSAFNDYLGAFRDFQDQLREIANEKAQKEAEIAAEKAKVQKVLNPTQADLGIFENPNGDKLVSATEKMVSTEEYGIDISQEQLAEAKKNGEAVRKQKEEAEKATQKLTSVDDRLAAMPQDIVESMTKSASLANQAGASPLLVILSEIKTAMVDGFNQVIASMDVLGTIGANPAINPATPGAPNVVAERRISKAEIINIAAKKVQELNAMRESGIKKQKEAKEAYASGNRYYAGEDFVAANAMIAKAEKGITDVQKMLLDAQEFNKAATLNFGDSAVKRSIAEGLLAVQNKWGFSVLEDNARTNPDGLKDSQNVKSIVAEWAKNVKDIPISDTGITQAIAQASAQANSQAASPRFSAEKMQELKAMREEGIRNQKAAMEAFASGNRYSATEDFLAANEMIAQAEQGIADVQKMLIDSNQQDKAASLDFGASAIKKTIADGLIAVKNKWGYSVLADNKRTNPDSAVDVKEVKPMVAEFAKQTSEYLKTASGFEKYKDGQVRDPNNTYTQDGSKMIKQVVAEAVAGTVDGVVAAQNQPLNGISGDVVKVKDEALAKQGELQTKELAKLEENRRGNKLETEGKTQDFRIANEKFIADQRESVTKMIDDLNNQRSNAQKSPRDKAIDSASSDSRSLIENMVNQRKAIKDIVDGLDIPELQRRLDAANASGNSEAAAYFQQLIDETNSVANTYRELDTQLQLDIDSTEAKRQAEEKYAAALFDASVAAEAQFGARQADIGARLDDKYVNQNERNRLEREQLSNQMALDNPMKLDELIKKYEDLGYTKEMSMLKAKNALEQINSAEFDKLEDSLDTVGNKLESTLGDLFTEMFSIDPTQNITDQFLSIFNNIAKNLQQYAGEKLNGYIMDALFENDKPNTESQADELAKEAANAANEAYKETTLSSVETKNAIDDEATESRGANLQSNASKMAGYIGAAASVVSAVQSGKTGSIIGSVLGGIAGAFLGGAGGAMMGSQLGGAIGGSFYNGGEVEAMMQKERTMSGGKQPRLIVAHAGEQVLTTKNKDAEAFRAMQANGVWDAMKSVSGYANGGMVGSKVSQARSGLAGILTNNNQKTTSNMTTVFNIQATEATLVPKLSSQLESKKRNLLG